MDFNLATVISIIIALISLAATVFSIHLYQREKAERNKEVSRRKQQENYVLGFLRGISAPVYGLVPEAQSQLVRTSPDPSFSAETMCRIWLKLRDSINDTIKHLEGEDKIGRGSS